MAMAIAMAMVTVELGEDWEWDYQEVIESDNWEAKLEHEWRKMLLQIRPSDGALEAGRIGELDRSVHCRPGCFVSRRRGETVES